MRIETLLNKVYPIKSFVYTACRFEMHMGCCVLVTTIKPRKMARLFVPVAERLADYMIVEMSDVLVLYRSEIFRSALNSEIIYSRDFELNPDSYESLYSSIYHWFIVSHKMYQEVDEEIFVGNVRNFKS